MPVPQPPHLERTNTMQISTERHHDALHWEARLWDVADGYPLTPQEAQDLADWVIGDVADGDTLTAQERQALLNLSRTG